MHQTKSIAIIGAGFSGICTAIHLIQQAKLPLSISIVEKSLDLCKGIAFGTTSPHHPLNVKASEMGAFADQQGHFYAWLKKSDQWRNLDPSFKSLTIDSESYLPRKLYGGYLQDVFRQALETAQKKGIQCTVLHGHAVDASLKNNGKLEVVLEDSMSLLVDDLVLAMGIPPIAHFSYETKTLLENANYIHNIWNQEEENQLKSQCIENKGKDKRIAIIGSGLTSVDVLFSLHSFDYRGLIHLISNKGTFPQVHQSIGHLPRFPTVHLKDYPQTICELFRLFKSKLKHADEIHGDWRQVINAFHPSTQDLWQSLSVFAKKQFLRHLFSIWNKHRHRMTPQSLEMIKGFKKKHQLIQTSGKVINVKVLKNKKLYIDYISSESRLSERLEADCVINCTGPNYDVRKSENRLMQNLLKKHLVIPDELGLGLKLKDQQCLAGRGEGKIYALGSLLFGELFEITSVPDIREQASAIAERITTVSN